MEIKETIKRKKINMNSVINTFIDALDQDIHGDGFIYVDISDYLKNDEIILFAELYKETIDQMNHKFEWPKEQYAHALKLYDALRGADIHNS